jgi:ferredoxin-NADP reductase
MTSLNLLLWITSGILLQLSIFVGIRYWRHWMQYRQLPDIKNEAGEIPSSHAENISASSWLGFRTFRVDRKIFEDTAQSICSFYLVPVDEKSLPVFQPGQFLTFSLALPPSKDGSEQLMRCYSLSDAPREDYYRVSIKRVPAPSGMNVSPGRSSNYFHDHVSVGSLLQVRTPAGHFYIDNSDDPVVLVCGGIGITPMLSMLNECLTQRPEREVWLFYGVRNSTELIMQSQLKALESAHSNFHLWICASRPLSEDRLGIEHKHLGHVDINLLRAQLPLKSYHYYICGPAPMLESIVPALEEWGVPESRIHYEAFGPASIKRAASVVKGNTQEAETAKEIVVKFAQSKKEFQWKPSDANLLEFAESNGIDVNFGCRAGGCGACQTTILSGEVSYRHPPDFDPEEGKCLLCVSTPKTSVTLEL